MKTGLFSSAPALLAAIGLCVAALPGRAQENLVTVSASEFQRLVYSAHLLTQMDENPELDAALQVLLEYQRRNPHSDPAAVAAMLQEALQRYPNSAPLYIRTHGHRAEVLAAYLDVLRQLPARTNFVLPNLRLLEILIGRAEAPTDRPQADVIHSGSQTLLSSEGELAERQSLVDVCTTRARGHAAFAAAMDALLQPETLVSLAHTPAQILANTNSPLHGNPTLQTLLALSTGGANGSVTVSSNQLLTLFTKETQSLWDTIHTNLALRVEILESQGDLLGYLTNQPAIDHAVEREDEVKQGQARQIASATAAILVQSKLMESAGPSIKLPTEMKVTGAALSSIAKGMSVLNSPANGTFTKVMTSGDFLSAGLQVFNLFLGLESPEDKIVREIGNIKLLIGDLATNMNYRFDRVDQSLTQIFDTLNDRFDQIEITLEGRFAHLDGDVDQIRLSLLDVQTELYRIERNLATFAAMDWRFDLIDDMNLAFGYEERVGNPMQYQDFVPSYVSLENVFYSHAYNRASSETLSRNSTLSVGDEHCYYQLSPEGATNVYAETLNYIKRCLREQLGLTAPFPAQPILANPQDWNAAAGAWLRLSLENPGYFRRYERTVGFPSRLDGIIGKGNDLTNFFRSLTFSGSGTNINWPLYNALLGHYSARLDEFIHQVEAAEQQYASDHAFTLETFRQWDPAPARYKSSATTVLESHNESPVIHLDLIPPGTPVRNGIIALGGDTSGSHGLALQSSGTVVGWGENDYGQSTVPEGLSNVIAVAAGHQHSVALTAEGTILSWGANYYDLTNTPAIASNAIAIAAGRDHSVALRADGTVVGWGYDGQGQATGVPKTNYPYGAMGVVTVEGQTLTNVVAIGAGFYYSLALKADGTVQPWGNNEYGETVVPPGVSNIAAIAAGGFHSLGIRSNGTVIAWGVNNSGQTNVPPGLSNVVAVAAGSHHSLALREDGTVVAWGNSDLGQTNVPVGLSDVVAIAADQCNSLALRSDGTLIVWGYNDWLWRGPVPVPSSLGEVVSIAAGSQHCLVLHADGSVSAWGDNQYNQTSIPEGLSNVIAIAAGDYHSLALKADRTVAAWGTGYWDYNQSRPPTDLSDVVAIAAGAEYSIALKNDGRIVPWGRSLQNAPSNLSNVVAIAAARYHCLALTIDGRVRAWGENYWNQCNVPASATNIIAVAAGTTHNLALRADGTVVAWGSNDAGKSEVPAGLNNVVAIAAGGSHSVALKDDGTVVSWGWNREGQCNVPDESTVVLAIDAAYNYTLFLTDAGSADGSEPPLLVGLRAPTPGFVFATLQGVNEHLLTSLDFNLHASAIELSGARALLQAVLELGMPHTMERDDVLHGFFYGSDSLAALDAARTLLTSEIDRLAGDPTVPPRMLQHEAPARLARFADRLEARLNDLAATGQPEIPRLVGHTLRLLNLLRDSWAAVPPPALEMCSENNSPRLVLFGEPNAHYTLQYRDSFSVPGWHATDTTNLHNDEIIIPPLSGPHRFYRALLPEP